MTQKDRDDLLIRLDERVKTLFTLHDTTTESINKLVEDVDARKRERANNWFRKANMIGLWVGVIGTIVFNLRQF